MSFHVTELISAKIHNQNSNNETIDSTKHLHEKHDDERYLTA